MSDLRRIIDMLSEEQLKEALIVALGFAARLPPFRRMHPEEILGCVLIEVIEYHMSAMLAEAEIERIKKL